MHEKIGYELSINHLNYWDDLFFNPEFIEQLFNEVYQCDQVKILSNEKDEKAGTHSRVIQSTSRISNIPGPIKKLMSNSTMVTETGKCDLSKNHYTFDLAMPMNKIKVKGGTKIFQNRDPSSIRVESTLDVQASIFGLGRIIEKFIIETFKKQMRGCDTFTSNWLLKLDK